LDILPRKTTVALIDKKQVVVPKASSGYGVGAFLIL
jgi:hypothetical protein